MICGCWNWSLNGALAINYQHHKRLKFWFNTLLLSPHQSPVTASDDTFWKVWCCTYAFCIAFIKKQYLAGITLKICSCVFLDTINPSYQHLSFCGNKFAYVFWIPAIIIWQEICSVMVRRCILVTSNHYWWRGPSPQWRCNTSNNALGEIILQEKQSSSTHTSNTNKKKYHKYWCIKRWGKYLQEKHSNNLQYIKYKKIQRWRQMQTKMPNRIFSASLGAGLTIFQYFQWIHLK